MDDLLQQGITAYKAGKRDEARKIFIAAVKQDPNSEQSWAQLFNVSNNDQERIHCLQQVLRINPKNEKASELLKKIRGDLTDISEQKIEAKKQSVISANQDGNRSPVLSMQGIQDMLDVYEDKLTITPNGFLALINKGMKGAKTISFYSIAAIQLKKPGGFTNGYIQFTLSGGTESRGGILDATKDENTVLFAAKDTDIVEKIKNYIEQQTQKLRTPAASSQSPISLASEIEKLVELKNKGILTDDEFQSAKKRLIG